MRDKVIGLMAGLGTGVALGVLFAPQSGKESRQAIRQKAQEGQAFANHTFDKGQDYVKRQGRKVVDQTNELMERGARIVAQQTDRINSAVQVGIEAYRSTVDAAEVLQANRYGMRS